mmetsp:Transcript_3177/g.6227  ORF Transcript_3177/g.6227 Transcript_3177/m.6227 type:complete len:481 (-) Transcript_3177:156-1598(-)
MFFRQGPLPYPSPLRCGLCQPEFDWIPLTNYDRSLSASTKSHSCISVLQPFNPSASHTLYICICCRATNEPTHTFTLCSLIIRLFRSPERIATPTFTMNRILFPTKSDSAQQRPSAQADEERDSGNFEDNRGYTGTGVGDDTRTRWEGLTALDMVEHVTKLAEEKMTDSQGRLLSTHCVDPSLMITTNDVATDCYVETTVDGSKKRGRETVADVIGGGGEVPGLLPMMPPLPPWDPSYIILTDPDPPSAKGAADKLSALAVEIESSPNYHRCTPSYTRIREQLAAATQFIHSNHIRSPTTRRLALDDLYLEAMQKMEELAKMVKDIEPAAAAVPMQVDSVTSSGRIAPPARGCTISRAGRKSNGEYSKKDFADYMQHWLRDNWTNPYPDDDGLAQIAEDCDTTPTVVSNWLINARTRKWRPAIVKAYDLGRPADLLKEDAINIFDGSPLRQVDGMPTIMPSPAGKSKKGRGRGKNSKSKK